MPEGGGIVHERAPTLDAERLFTSYSGFLYTLVAIASAIWVVLVGSAIPAVGDTKLGIVGFACGSVIGTALAVWSVGLPGFRYGVDSIDVSKAALGVRGSAVTLVGLILMSLGWAGVALALVARGCATLGATLKGHAGATDERMVLVIALLLFPLLYLLVRHGLDAIRRINQVAGPGILLLTCVSLVLLCWKFGVGEVLEANVPAEQTLTADRMKAFAYALEFGVMLALSWWPYIGGLYRFVKFRRHAVGPIMVGGPLIGNTFSASVAALATVHLGSSDPAVWLVALAGPAVGSVLVSVVLVLSLPAICMLVYFTASSAQQLPLLSKWSWNRRVLLALAPLTLVAFNTSWTLTHIVTVATFGSLIFVALCGIVLADVWIVRRGRIELAHLYVDGHAGRYWYTGGVNWIAMLAIALGCAGYLYLYDPISL
ncbi:MAG: cytosine permease, partial [Dehalococcoidia bacterium]